MQLGAEVREALLQEDWPLRLKQAISFAAEKISRLRWKRGYKGPLPDGHDENTIAAEAISRLFDGDCRITSALYTKEQLDYDLMRLVSNVAHACLRRKETVLTRSEQELEPPGEDGDHDGEFERVADKNINPAEFAVRTEAKAKLEKFKSEFKAFLGNDDQLTEIFDCICNGITQREEIALLLEVTPQIITNARKRLDRKLAGFALKNKDYPEILIQEMTNV